MDGRKKLLFCPEESPSLDFTSALCSCISSFCAERCCHVSGLQHSDDEPASEKQTNTVCYAKAKHAKVWHLKLSADAGWFVHVRFGPFGEEKKTGTLLPCSKFRGNTQRKQKYFVGQPNLRSVKNTLFTYEC